MKLSINRAILLVGLIIFIGITSFQALSENYEISARMDAYGIMTALSNPVERENLGTLGRNEFVIKELVVSTKTVEIPGRVGTRFGYQFTIFNVPVGEEITLTKRVKYPTMHFPDGKTSTGFTTAIGPFQATKKGQTFSFSEGYSFDEKFEIVPGDWVIEIWYGKKRLLQKIFHILPPVKTALPNKSLQPTPPAPLQSPALQSANMSPDNKDDMVLLMHLF